MTKQELENAQRQIDRQRDELDKNQRKLNDLESCITWLSKTHCESFNSYRKYIEINAKQLTEHLRAKGFNF